MPTHFEMNLNTMNKVSSIPFNRDRCYTGNDTTVDEADEPPNGFCHSPTDFNSSVGESSPSLSPPTSPSSATLSISSVTSSPLSTSSSSSGPSIVLSPLQKKTKKYKSKKKKTSVVKSTSSESISPIPSSSLHDPTLPGISWVNPKLEARTSHTGSGVFALVPIPKNEVLIVWTGRIVSAEEALPIMQTDLKHYILQIAMGFYQIPILNYREAADWTNHSCSPNAGFGHRSPIILSAMRDIQIGEQLTFDYAMCETDERLWEPMECECESEHCRKWITANDWKNNEELWEKYAGYWSPHVEFEIQKIKAARLQQQP
jgi:hypothetical protein